MFKRVTLKVTVYFDDDEVAEEWWDGVGLGDLGEAHDRGPCVGASRRDAGVWPARLG